MSKRTSTIVLVLGALLAFCSAWLLLYHLNVQPLEDDEASYAEIVRESFETNHFIYLQFRGHAYYNKPPLLFWMMDSTTAFVSDSAEAARLPSVIAGMLLVGSVILCIYEVIQDGIAAAFGGMVLLTTASMLVLTRAARFDSLVALWTVLAVYAFMRSFKNQIWFLWLGVFLGLLMITKSPVMVVFPGLGILAIILTYRKFKWLQSPYLWGGVAIALAVAVPWYIYETLRGGLEFWRVFLVVQIVSRVQQNLLGENITNPQYFSYLAIYAAPWAEVFLASLAAIPFLWKKLSQETKALVAASLVVIAAVLISCLVTISKSFRYLYTIYPFAAIIIGIVVYEIWLVVRSMHARARIFIASMILLTTCAVPWAAYNGFFENPAYPFFNNSPTILTELKTMGEILRARHAPTFFAYSKSRVWLVIYYSGLTNPYYIPTLGGYKNIYVMVPSENLSAMKVAYPGISLLMVYTGQYYDLVLASEPTLECFPQTVDSN